MHLLVGCERGRYRNQGEKSCIHDVSQFEHGHGKWCCAKKVKKKGPHGVTGPGQKEVRKKPNMAPARGHQKAKKKNVMRHKEPRMNLAILVPGCWPSGSFFAPSSWLWKGSTGMYT